MDLQVASLVNDMRMVKQQLQDVGQRLAQVENTPNDIVQLNQKCGEVASRVLNLENTLQPGLAASTVAVARLEVDVASLQASVGTGSTKLSHHDQWLQTLDGDTKDVVRRVNAVERQQAPPSGMSSTYTGPASPSKESLVDRKGCRWHR